MPLTVIERIAAYAFKLKRGERSAIDRGARHRLLSKADLAADYFAGPQLESREAMRSARSEADLYALKVDGNVETAHLSVRSKAERVFLVGGFAFLGNPSQKSCGWVGIGKRL